VLWRLQGFLLHVMQEHNMWSYMHFMLHLSNTNPSDYTALELHVHKLVSHSRYSAVKHSSVI